MNTPIALRRFLSAAPIALAALIALCPPTVSGQTINTVAGGGVGDGLVATLASVNGPSAVAVDTAGNLYIADTWNHRIRKVDTSGVISTVAGNGSPGFSGDGAAATSAGLNFPQSLTLDTAGNLYIADSGNRRIRKVNSSGVISTVAGNGLGEELGGDGGAATEASLSFVASVAADGVGNLYITDNYNHRIRKVNASGVISTVAGNGLIGFSGDGGAATSSRLASPRGVAVDSAGNLYIADTSNSRIRKVSASGVISTVAGTGNTGFSGDGGAATSASLNRPSGVAVDSAGNLYIADELDRRVRKVSTSGVISTVAGGVAGGSNDTDGRPGTETFLFSPVAITVDRFGNLFIADPQDHRIRKLNTSGIVSTVAGNRITGGFDGDGEAATSARLRFPKGIAADSAGNLYIADTENHRIRKVSASGIISTVAGNGEGGFSGDGGAATGARLFNPSGVAVDSAGNFYIADELNHRIRRVSTSGVISTIVGDGSARFNGDGQPAVSTSLSSPQGIALDSAGNLYIADSGNTRIRKVNTSGVVSTVAGNGTSHFNGDGQPATSAWLRVPQGVALDRTGNLYIADTHNQRVRMVNTSGVISTVAGNGESGFSGDDGAATSARLFDPSGVAVDSAGNLYITESTNQRIRKVNTSGVISTVAGSEGVFGFTGDGTLAVGARVSSPFGVAVDSTGNLYIADTRNHRIRKVTSSVPISNYQGAWWAGAAENGWGLSLIQHGQILAAGWYYFNAQGQPTWAIVPGCIWNAANTACTGNVMASTGSWLGSYTGILTQSAIGTVTFSFTSPTAGTMSWNIGGVLGTKNISMLNYASGASPSGIDYTDIWWAGAAQNGWGVALLQQGGVLAGAWYTYNQQNQPVWYLINGGTWTSPKVFTAPLTRATGSPLIGATYNPANLNTSNVGTVTFTFTDAANATMSYTVDGVTQTKSITRLAF